MKILKWLAIGLVAYAGLVIVFESLLGYFQPTSARTLRIRTFGEDGEASERVLARLESDGKLYVAANHWPRAWYRDALENPDVEAVVDGVEGDYRAVPVPVSGAEGSRVDGEHGLNLVFRIVTGFPPRYFLRLDPR